MTRPMTAATLRRSPATEPMTQRLFTSALFAGLSAGLIAVLLQFFLMEPLILEGEEYESGAKVHFAGILDRSTEEPTSDGHTHATEAEASDGHAHPEADEDLTARFALAFFATFVAWVGYGLLMVAGFALANHFGIAVAPKEALLWGVAGFVSFQLMPGLGLSPELPGVPAADLQARQLWWVGTAVATIAALALFAYGRGVVFIAIGVGLLIAPHLIGAPRLNEFLGTAPPGLAAEFVTHSMVVGMAAWVVLGLAAGYFWNRPQAA